MNNTNDFLRDYYLRKQLIDTMQPTTRFGLEPWLNLALIVLGYIVYCVALTQLFPGGR